jgi:transcriptional regulator with PAS, ATPase and Fis domain
VLLTGESGTGKELAARAIHFHSAQKNGPFIALNCSAFAESLIESELFGHEEGAFTGATKSKSGRFELANGGTLFLDEIGDISLPLQTKLLRILETKQFEKVGGSKSISINARIITATNKNLEEEIQAGRFREDLFYRINVVNIHLPPLRERIDDLPLLIDHFIQSFNKLFRKSIEGVSKDVYRIFTKYSWPGNIRELENVLEHCFVICRGMVIEAEHLPEKISSNTKRTLTPSTSEHSPKRSEREMIIGVLEKHRWNKSRTAAELEIDPSTLWRKMKRLRIIAPEY